MQIYLLHGTWQAFGRPLRLFSKPVWDIDTCRGRTRERIASHPWKETVPSDDACRSGVRALVVTACGGNEDDAESIIHQRAGPRWKAMSTRVPERARDKAFPNELENVSRRWRQVPTASRWS